MKTMNINQRIEKALKDQDVVKIMNKACQSFSRQLDQDTIYTCKINALWKSLVNYNPSKNTKFTTYLYKGVLIECLKSIKFENKGKFVKKILHENIPSKSNDNILIELVDILDSDEDKQLLIDKYMNKTIQEMSESRSYSRETVRKKLKKIYHKIKKESE